MKKIILYLSVFTMAATVLYYGSYRFFYSNSKTEGETNESEFAMQGTDSFVTRTTAVVMEYYDKKSDRTTYENLQSNTEFLGYNREQLIAHTQEYMKNMSMEDEQKGLYDYQLISFQDNKITLRKCYDTPEETQNEPKFFVGILDHMVVIYYNDTNHTVYEKTEIDSRLLPQTVANQLSEGIYFYEEYDLYNFLEAYTS